MVIAVSENLSYTREYPACIEKEAYLVMQVHIALVTAWSHWLHVYSYGLVSVCNRADSAMHVSLLDLHVTMYPSFRCLCRCDSPAQEWVLLYRGSRDGFHARTFHSCCDEKGPTVILVRVSWHQQNLLSFVSISHGVGTSIIKYNNSVILLFRTKSIYSLRHTTQQTVVVFGTRQRFLQIQSVDALS